MSLVSCGLYLHRHRPQIAISIVEGERKPALLWDLRMAVPAVRLSEDLAFLDRETRPPPRRRGPANRPASRPCASRSKPVGTRAPTGCASNCTSRCSGRSNKPAVSASSYCAASRKCAVHDLLKLAHRRSLTAVLPMAAAAT